MLLLLLLLGLRDCHCAEDGVPAQVATPTAGAPGEGDSGAPPLGPLTGRVPRRDRPAFDAEPPGPVPWIDSFRVQVTARGPRLSECFVGADRPGALRWSAAVEPVGGHVSDQTLEPAGQGDALTRQQRLCVHDVLSSPPYRLPSDTARATPTRVGMVIEF